MSALRDRKHATNWSARLMQRHVGVDDADERDVREMQTLRDHLGADEDVDQIGRAHV